MSKTLFIGDTHFYHENIISYENRPFSSVHDMNSTLIKNWNLKVGKNDRIIVVGDFCFHANKYAQEILEQLNGYKVLIMGNHDTISPKTFLSAGFDEVSRYPILFDKFFLISHEPLYINSNMPYANIFAHVHGNPAFADFSNQTFCVSVERKELNYFPIEYDRIRNLMGIKQE